MREVKLLKYCGLFIILIVIYYFVYLNRISNHFIEILPTQRKSNHQPNNPTIRNFNFDNPIISLTYKTTNSNLTNQLHEPTRPKVIVFLHIQKTGGTLIERRLAKDGILNHNCQCFDYKMRCLCQDSRSNTWLFSRYSTGWACGLHADLTELKECVNSKLDKIDRRQIHREYDYFTILRHPVDRFISEWLHVKRGSTWHMASLRCLNQSPPLHFYQRCYTLKPYMNYERQNSTPTYSLDWAEVPLNLFLECPYNLASNRQTRMLANLSQLGCYQDLTNWTSPVSRSENLTNPQLRLLKSAKLNLVGSLSGFGLNEHMIYSQYLIQKRLGIVFNRLWVDLDFLNQSLTVMTHASLVRSQFSQTDLIRIQNSNRLDLKLYAFARRMFLLRLVYQIRHDSGLPYRLRRAIATLWLAKHPSNLIGLDWLILIGPNQQSDPKSFRLRLNLAIMHLLVRRGSKHAPLGDLVREHEKQLKKLSRDLGNT